MIKQVHIGLQAKDLAKATDFYQAIGFELNKNFSGPSMSQFKMNDGSEMSLFSQEVFMSNSPVENIDTNQFNLVSCALSLDSVASVDKLMNQAIEAGGQAFKTKQDNDFMYMDGFVDLDGNVWTVYYMKV